MHGLLLIAGDGDTYVAWHDVRSPPKDRGEALRREIRDWIGEASATLSKEPALFAS